MVFNRTIRNVCNIHINEQISISEQTSNLWCVSKSSQPSTLLPMPKRSNHGFNYHVVIRNSNFDSLSSRMMQLSLVSVKTCWWNYCAKQINSETVLKECLLLVYQPIDIMLILLTTTHMLYCFTTPFAKRHSARNAKMRRWRFYN